MSRGPRERRATLMNMSEAALLASVSASEATMELEMAATWWPKKEVVEACDWP